MPTKLLILGVLGACLLGAPFCALALAGPDSNDRAERAPVQASDRVWVDGHYERTETRRTLPAEVRSEWVPDRYEVIDIPAVTERVRVAAVVERVRAAPIVERTWVPPVRERYWQHGYWDLSGWRPAQWDTRVVRRGHYAERVIDAGTWEDRVVRPERWERRIVVPAREERRIVEKGYARTVTVRPERVDVIVERVWIQGHWEDRRVR